MKFEILRGMWLDQGMAKYTEPRFNNYACPNCNTPFDVQIEQTAPDDWMPLGTPITRHTIIQKQCMCALGVTSTFQPATRKETTVSKHFATNEAKNLALNTIVSKVEQLERTLYNRVDALAKVEAEHNKLVADASNALNRVLAESIHSGIEEEDFELHLPDLENVLSERFISVVNDMSLANVLEGV